MRFAAALVFLIGCHDRRAPYDVAVMTRQLGAAGYTVTASPTPNALVALMTLPGVTDISCIDANKSGATDTFCVIRCNDDRTCAKLIGNTGESFGDWQRGASIAVHQRCALTPKRPTSTDCGTARAIIE
jgi:hypothetical protein